MLMRSYSKKKQQGFTLLEALISVAILSFGMLAIGSFQAKLISESAYNKARSEAVALAQAKIDDLRSYSTEHEMVEKLLNTPRATPDPALLCQAANAEYCYPVDVPTTSTSYNDTPDGINASFTRTWNISRAVTSGNTAANADDDSLMSNIVVQVSWTDRKNEKQSVSLESDVTFRNPRGAADVQDVSEPTVQSPTGNAYLGDGSLSAEDLTALKGDPAKYNVKDNNDGTMTGDHDLDGDLELIVEKDDGTAEVVLTLPKACKILDADGNPLCSGFVTISGSVFIHENNNGSSYHGGITGMTADDVFVIASDAAYCSRYVPTGTPPTTTTTTTTTDGDGNTVTTVNTTLNTTNDLTSPVLSGGDMYLNNDGVKDFTGAGENNYSYFNYTCYLGGGWYGNIGLIMLGENSQDYVCVGDPDASDSLVADKWRRVEIAKRRVYRGMLHKYQVDNNGDAVLDGNGKHIEVKVDPNDDTTSTIFYSQGIRDEAIYPNGNWSVRNYGHDYVIGKNNTQSIDECKLMMSLPDAVSPHADNNSTHLFYHRTGDFVCLNEDWENAPSGTLAKFLGSPWHYLNAFDTAIYDARTDCPYDPSVPPSKKYTFSGTISTETLHSSWGSSDPASSSFEGNINTSDGYANCTIGTIAATQVSYSCEYYVWSAIDGTEYPWMGSIFVNTPSDVVCAPGTITTPVDADYVHEAIYVIPSPGINDNTKNDVDFDCKDLVDYGVQGVVTTGAGNDLGTAGLAVNAYDADGVELGVCSWTNTADATSWEYSCDNLQEKDYKLGLTADIKISWTNSNFTCGVAAAGGSCTSPVPFIPGEALWSYDGLIDEVSPAQNAGHDLALIGPKVTYVIDGRLNNVHGTNGLLDGTTVNTSTGVSCTVAIEAASKDATYSCTVTHDSSGGAPWVGSIHITPAADAWCDAVPALSITGDATATTVDCVVDTTAPVTIIGSVYAGFPSDTSYLDFIGSLDPRTDTVTEFDAWLENASGAVDGTCTFTTSPALGDGIVKEHSYTCTSNDVSHNDTWSGSVNFRTNGTTWAKFCYPGTGVPTATAAMPVAGPLPPGDSSTVIEYIVVTDEADTLGFVKCPNTP